MEENKQKNILVTGGAGFIGSHLCKALINLGQKVICLDNLFTGTISNIQDLNNEPNFEFVNHDIIEPYFRENIDEIYNLACPASPLHYQINPIKTVKTCTLGVINILGLAKKNNAKIVAYNVLYSGFLSGKFSKDTLFDKSDRRHRQYQFLGSNLNRLIDKINVLKEKASTSNMSITHYAIQEIVKNESILSIITGIKNKDQLTENINSLI